MGQVRALADSGINYAAAALSNPETLSSTLGNNPFDNGAAFQGIIVQTSDQPRSQGDFSLVAPVPPTIPTGPV